MSLHSPHLVNRPSARSNSSTPTATTPTPSNLAQPLTVGLASSSAPSPSFSALALRSSTMPPQNLPTYESSSQNHSSSHVGITSSPSRPSQCRQLRRMSSPGTQPSSSTNASLDSCSLSSKRVNQLGLDSISSHFILDDTVIGGECGVVDGGKVSDIQPLSSENWIAHHLTIVLQHSFTVSSPNPIPSNNSDSLPSYCHPRPKTQFLNLRNLLVPDALRNKLSIASLSSFTTSTATDEDEDEETDEVEEAESQDSTASSCYFPNLNQINPLLSSQPLSSIPRSHSTSPSSQQPALPPVNASAPSLSSRPRLLQILNTWSFDANSLSPLQIRCSLHILLSTYLKYTPGFLQQLVDLGVVNPEQCLRGLVDNLEVAYDSRNAYHNFRHAVDVVQAVYTILSHEGIVPPLGWVLEKEFGSGSLTSWYRQPVGRIGVLLDEMSVWALLLAAAGHDVGHPGLSNAFMVNARTPIAYVFSDGAVLENFHRITFTRMLREHGFHKVVDGHTGFRQVLAGAVLATDMGRHFPIVEELKRLASKWNAPIEELTEGANDALADKVLIAAGLIKCGDISNSTRPHHISLTWSSCLLNEWSRQAALEADLQLPVSVVTLDPAEKRAQAKSQIGFTSLFVLPLFTVIEQLSPGAFRPFANNCRLGLKTWQKVVEKIDEDLHSSDPNAAINPLHHSSSSCTDSSSGPQVEETSPHSASDPSLDSFSFSPFSGSPCEFFPRPVAIGPATSFPSIPQNYYQDSLETRATPKSKAGGWWGGPSTSFSPPADGLHAADSTFSSVSTSSASTVQDPRISPHTKDYNQTSELIFDPKLSNNTLSPRRVGRSSFLLPSNGELLSPRHSFTLKVSMTHSERQGSASSSSDEGKANSSNDDSSFSSLGSPSSPPRSPYFTSGVPSASSTSSSHDAPPPSVTVQDSRIDSFIPQKPPPISEPSNTRLQSPQRSRDKGMSVDIGLVRRNVARASLPFRKKSYSPHLVNQQVACAKGCGKVTVKCVKCAAESKLKMYRSLSLVKPSLLLRPEHILGIRSTIKENSPGVTDFKDNGHFRSFTHHPADLGNLEHSVATSSLAGLLKGHSSDPTINRIASSPQELNWPPHPFRPLC